MAIVFASSARADAVRGAVTAGIQDQTTAGRKLLAAALPPYPPEEQGRWTQSCVALYFTVRPDGKTDQFVVLEASRPNRDERKFENLPKTQQVQESQEMWRFVHPAMTALYRWQYAPARKASEEIAVFRYERSEMGGRLMKVGARRLDLGTPSPFACTSIDPVSVRSVVARARGH